MRKQYGDENYQQVDGRSDDKGPIPSEVGISDICPEYWHQEHGARPVGHVVCGIDSALVQLVCYVEHQVGCYAIECHSFKHLIHCNIQQVAHKHFNKLIRLKTNNLPTLYKKCLVTQFTVNVQNPIQPFVDKLKNQLTRKQVERASLAQLILRLLLQLQLHVTNCLTINKKRPGFLLQRGAEK